MNRDTLYSSAVFDLDAGPVTITMPDAGKRFMSLMIVDQDHYVPAVYYGAGSHTLTREKIGTRYVNAVVRTLVDPDDPKDVEAGPRAAGCDQGRAERRRQVRSAELGPASQKKVRDALLVLGIDDCPISRKRSAPRARSIPSAI